MVRPSTLIVPGAVLVMALSASWAATADGDVPGVQIDIHPDVARRPIPASVYGANEGGIDACPLRRHGGNRFTGFNWETSASNAGSDWVHHSDWYLAPEQSARGPGALLARRLAHDRERGASSLVTVQLAGYVSADAAGTVEESETAPSPRWNAVVLEASSPHQNAAGVAPQPGEVHAGEPRAPDLTDGRVYLDEQVRDLVRRFGLARDGGVQAYALDNEPALWPVTHPRIHPEPATWAELVDKGVAAAELITREDPSAQVFGPVLYGWAAFQDLQGAPDAGERRDGQQTFIEHYLAAMSAASQRAGRRLLHALDVHWYPEAMGASRVVSEAVDASTWEARVQAPRSLWDTDYREHSWIVDVIGEPIALIPRLQRSIEGHYPGTGLAITEYNFGAAHDVSGGLAQADALGTFGRFGVTACYWPMGGEQDYVEAAYGLYLGDGAQRPPFGDVSVRALSSDVARVSVYAATSSLETGRLTLVVLNKSREQPVDVDLRCHLGDDRLEGWTAWRFDAERAGLTPVGAGPELSENVLSDRLPPASATFYELRLR